MMDEINITKNGCIGTPCLICGEPVEIFCLRDTPKICEECSKAVMAVRELLTELQKMKEKGKTMTDREKLIELLEQAESAVYWNSGDGNFIEKIADHLIQSGVTVQRWIPVAEMLPEAGVLVICACKTDELHVLSYDDVMDNWDAAYGHICYRKEFVTHWMPLPPAPEEETQ